MSKIDQLVVQLSDILSKGSILNSVTGNITVSDEAQEEAQEEAESTWSDIFVDFDETVAELQQFDLEASDDKGNVNSSSPAPQSRIKK